MRLATRLLLVIVPLVLSVQPSFGETETTREFLSERFAGDFPAESATFFISLSSGATVVAPAEVITVERPNGKGGRQILGTAVTLEEGTEVLEYAVLVKGSGDKHLAIPPRQWERRERFLQSIDDLRLHLEARKGLLRALEEERRHGDETLRRLRADVDLISDIGRIVQVKEELMRKQSELESAQKNIELFERFFAPSKPRTAPHNVAQREAELTQQLSLLVGAAKAAETENRKRGGQDPQRRLSLAELGGTADLAALERQFELLRSKREQFQSQLESFKRQAAPTSHP